jgi:hypothetical protein
MDQTMTAVLDCGHVCVPDGIAAGYAITLEDRKICYACADRLQLEQIENAQIGDRITLYVGSEGKSITTWSGGHMMRAGILARSRTCGFGYTRIYDTWGFDKLGRVWYGRGSGSGMVVTLRLTKGTA